MSVTLLIKKTAYSILDIWKCPGIHLWDIHLLKVIHLRPVSFVIDGGVSEELLAVVAAMESDRTTDLENNKVTAVNNFNSSIIFMKV